MLTEREVAQGGSSDIPRCCDPISWRPGAEFEFHPGNGNLMLEIAIEPDLAVQFVGSDAGKERRMRPHGAMTKGSTDEVVADVRAVTGPFALFGEFWRVIDLNESYVRQYGHLTWHPGLRDGWDEQLERAYEAIGPHLSALRQPALYVTPAGAKGFNPYEAETGHQALMFFLNPPENLFGETWILTSPEYLKIKHEAISELERLKASTNRPGGRLTTVRSRRRFPKRSPGERTSEARLLLRYLFLRHSSPDSSSAPEPLTQADIGKDFGWHQTKVSRVMSALFREGGMKQYKGMFVSDRLRGYLKKLADGSTDVDALDED